jgi:hypothetical protein
MDKFNICLIKPENYLHSYAFLELGELIHYSLQDLGYESLLSFNHVKPSFKNIIIGAHLLSSSAILNLPTSSVILNTEQIYGDATPWSRNIFYNAVKIFEIWDYSEKNIEKFASIGIHQAKHFKIGFQKELIRIDTTKDKDIDVLFYGGLNKRRKDILEQLEAKGLRVKTLFGVYAEVRDEWIERSKLVLNHHYFDAHIFEIVRVFYLLTNAVAVLGEVNETTSIDSMCKDGIYSAKYESLVDACVAIVKDDVLRMDLQHQAIHSISRYPQKLFTQEVISANGYSTEERK